jgi:hypothetical protein
MPMCLTLEYKVIIILFYIWYSLYFYATAISLGISFFADEL